MKTLKERIAELLDNGNAEGAFDLLVNQKRLNELETEFQEGLDYLVSYYETHH